jgi:D-glycero-beta-D-manno-heptose 1-phosphate adenylyltransferase
MTSDQSVIDKINQWKQLKHTVVLATGVFDILHIEHIRFLKEAKATGDKLVVGIESDLRVKSIKGSNRPINNQAIRFEQVSQLKPVDQVFILPQQFDSQADWEDLFATLKPAIYAVSSHTSWLENKQLIAEKYGATLAIVHQFNPDYSTTNIFERLKSEF